MNAVFRISEPDSGDGSGSTPAVGMCETLPVSMVSFVNSSDAFIAQWIFDNGDSPVEVQVSLHPDGRIDMHARLPTELQQVVVLGNTGIYGEAERSEESMSMAGNHGFVYLTSDPCIDDWTGVTCGTVPWPPGQDECEAELDCESLGWNPDEYGTSDVCGSSLLQGLGGCAQGVDVTFATAAAQCNALGARLCSAEEILLGEGDFGNCGDDSERHA